MVISDFLIWGSEIIDFDTRSIDFNAVCIPHFGLSEIEDLFHGSDGRHDGAIFDSLGLHGHEKRLTLFEFASDDRSTGWIDGDGRLLQLIGIGGRRYP